MSEKQRDIHRAAILAVGTELTDGQLANSNACWLSAKLDDLGIPVFCHMTVPDNHSEILSALKYLEKDHDLLFVTGGLGPTKDDFTRNVISDWCGKPLVMDEGRRQRLQDRFAQRGRPYFDFQSQQCFFPSESEVIDNERGTADAFFLKKANVLTWVLPGPPREIEGLWKKSIQKQIAEKTTFRKTKVLKTWLCFGAGESIISKVTEEVLEQTPFETGYRAHHPYLEVKVWGEPEDFDRFDQLNKLDEKLSDYVISRERKKWSDLLIEILQEQKKDVRFYDASTGGQLSLSLKSLISAKETEFRFEFLSLSPRFLKSIDEGKKYLKEEKNSFAIFSLSEKEVLVMMKNQSGVQLEKLETERYQGKRLQEWLAEKACQVWLGWL